MSDEARVQSSLFIKTGHINYQSQPITFLADVAGVKGPSPGAITATTAGVAVDFSELTTPGLCRIQNLDNTNYVEYGIKDTSTNTFYPLGEIAPGETYVLKLSRNLQEEYYPSTGTGTSTPTNSLFVKANTASCVVLIEAFEA